MRLAVIAGIPGSGKTSLIRDSGIMDEGSAAILNNDASADLLSGIRDIFPFKSPCARVRQFRFRTDKMEEENHPDILIAEPPGACLDLSSPMLNPIYAERKDISIAPLITVFRPETFGASISKRTTEGLRTWNMIDESDVVVISYSDTVSDGRRKEIVSAVADINSDAEVVFYSETTKEGASAVRDIVLSERTYRRPLVN